MPSPRGKGPGPVQRLLAEGVAHHRQGRLSLAAAAYDRVLLADPRNADGLHLRGLVAHQQGDQALAERLMRDALVIDPRPAAFHNSLGAVMLAQQRAEEALKALDQALARDPLLAQAHNNRGNALQRLGRLREAIAAYGDAIGIEPDYAEAHANRARAQHSLGHLKEAEADYRRAIALRSDRSKDHRGLGDVLGELGDREGARAAYLEAIRLDPTDGENHGALASLLERASDLEAGLAAARKALRLAPGDIRALVAAARCERRLGRPEAGLALLRDIDLSGHDEEARAHVLFERAALQDRLGDPVQAYADSSEANRLAMSTPAGRAVDAAAYPRLIRQLAERFTRSWVESWTETPACDLGSPPPPFFLIGFPRSGTTLLDQILDSHPALSTIEEKDCVDIVRRDVDRLPEGYPDALAGLTADAVQTLRRRYFTEASRYLGQGPVTRIVDKMPLNTIDVGLIHRLFPGTKLILALRHPCDVVLSGFMQAFKPNAAMVHLSTLADAARFYGAVMGLWLRYRDVLPLQVVTVRYEDLVADPEGETRRLLDGLGLPWDPAVLTYADRARAKPIATPSYHQVVQPIYRRSVGRWQSYRAAFTDVLPILQPFLDAFGYGVSD
jgi:tetratricopeptide (TPR) repeat protein